QIRLPETDRTGTGQSRQFALIMMIIKEEEADMRRCAGRLTAVLLTLTVAALSLAACGGKKETEPVVRATRVETQKAERGSLDITGTYIGTVAPHNTVNVTPLVSGTVLTVNVKVGDKVKAGDVLCRFDDKAAQLQLQSAQNAVESAKAGKEAAEDQIDAAQAQAEASITSMEGQIKTLKAQRKSYKEQLEQLKNGIDQLKAGAEAAQQAAEAAKNVYDSTNALFIQYQAFLSANPDCLTTAGLMAAAIPPVEINTISPADAGTGATYGDQYADPEETPSKAQEEAAAKEKQETAAALLEELGKIPMTVEYLTDAGLSTLKDQMEQAQETSKNATSGYSQAQASITQLESGISQLNAQIEALEDNIDAAWDAADATGSTKAYDAQIKAAKTGVESAQYQVDLYTVTSPIDGVVESVNVAENEISAQGYPAFTISDKEAMEVSFYVPEEVRDFLRAGNEVMVETTDGEVKGRISDIGTAVDPQKGLFMIVAQITSESKKELLSNTSVSLTLVTNSVKDQILIPFDSVYYDNDQAYVFLADDGKAVRRDVTAGLYNNEMIAITEGLNDGAEVITTWGAGLKDGAPIEVITKQQ
ncbi:MAG: efflux RND transporter periplasmic adaptor subunit, partial [Eubacteriales bacterium]|nr:efflux RND transporter periplasmic adaptor subunit [Eubacteriales bacterium]